MGGGGGGGGGGGERAKERGESLITFSPPKREAPQARIQDFEMGGEFL